ncbi:hypothetical protein [Tepidibacter hydrothermalis]|uniref:Lipoprotein n=1 Tax=Tepidibacter hydrothermalis TaxID=3036126 RepID=A0ABY8E9Q4_9FIRM|nr:hypothetical protein [Tepidibacter hydrothermalis]WFD09633.1 hypothetical protein P4S50_14745 [Tepidibacter hydrothermalis]
MKQILILIGIIISITGCNTESIEKKDLYGFYDTSYENGMIEGVAYHESIQLNSYGETDKKVEEKYNLILEFLKNEKLTEDEYVKIFEGTNTKDLEEYFVIKNELENNKYYFKIYAIDRNLKTNELSIKNSIKVDSSINEVKTSLFSLDKYLLISSEAPSSTYMENIYLKWENNKFEFLEKYSFDPSVEYFEKKMSLLEDGKLDEAMELEENYLYPYTYSELLYKSSIMALNTSFEKAKQLSKEEKWEDSLKYLEYGVGEYLILLNETDDLSYLLENEMLLDFEEDEENYGYKLEKKKIVDIFTLYQQLLEKNGKDDLAKGLKLKLDEFTK